MEYEYHVTCVTADGQRKTGIGSIELVGTPIALSPKPEPDGDDLEARMPTNKIHIGFAKDIPVRGDFYSKFFHAMEELEAKVRRQFARLPYHLDPNSPIYIKIERLRKTRLKNPQTGQSGRTILRLKGKIYFANSQKQTMEIPLGVDFDYATL